MRLHRRVVRPLQLVATAWRRARCFRGADAAVRPPKSAACGPVRLLASQAPPQAPARSSPPGSDGRRDSGLPLAFRMDATMSSVVASSAGGPGRPRGRRAVQFRLRDGAPTHHHRVRASRSRSRVASGIAARGPGRRPGGCRVFFVVGSVSGFGGRGRGHLSGAFGVRFELSSPSRPSVSDRRPDTLSACTPLRRSRRTEVRHRAERAVRTARDRSDPEQQIASAAGLWRARARRRPCPAPGSWASSAMLISCA